MRGNRNLILNDRPCADLGRPSDDYAAPDDRIFPDAHMRPDHAIFAHSDSVRDIGESLYLGVRADVFALRQRRGMDRELAHVIKVAPEGRIALVAVRLRREQETAAFLKLSCRHVQHIRR